MSNVIKYQPPSIAGADALSDPKMLGLIRRTVARDTNNDEFDLFIATCRAIRLDPLRKQVFAFVYNKDKPEKRQLTIVTAISGLRTIADRTGAYRPDENEPEIHFDESLKGQTNPLGIVKALVRVWKWAHGSWHKVTGVAYWSEFAPIRDEWAFDEASGKRKPTGCQELDTSGHWPRAGRHQISKCAEALALRKAWPDDFSNVHAEEEIDRQRFLDLSPAEAVEAGEAQARLERIGGKDTLIADFLKGDMEPLEMVPVGQFADRALAFIEQHKDEPSQITLWANKNRAALKEFWARAPGDALELKKELEKATAGGQEG